MTFYMTGLAYVYDSDDDSYYNPSFPCRFCNVPDFSSRKEAAQHEARTHYVCTDCDQRHDSWQDLTQHCRQIGCSFVCTGCHWTGKIWHFDRDGYRRHLEENNVCRDCERHFDTPSNLVHHRLTHRAPIYPCLGCNRTFTTYGGMILHLEANTCPSQITFYDICQSAAMCFQWSKYIADHSIRQDFLNRQDLYSPCNRELCFKCPACNDLFPKMSSLFMHVESPACWQELDAGAIWKLRKWLDNRHG